MSDQNKAPLSLFQGYGVEIEYMVVDAESREIRSIVDTLLDDLERSPDASTRTEGNPSGRVEWSNELAAIETYLAEYPSIRFILDVHRDAIGDAEGNQYKVISEIDGVGTSAQMTLVMGSDGSGLAHEHWMENLKLAVALQDNILQSYPTLMRPILLRNSRYNQHATTGSWLVEGGAAGNSPEEAALAGRLFAQQMADYLIDLGK